MRYHFEGYRTTADTSPAPDLLLAAFLDSPAVAVSSLWRSRLIVDSVDAWTREDGCGRVLLVKRILFPVFEIVTESRLSATLYRFSRLSAGDIAKHV